MIYLFGEMFHDFSEKGKINFFIEDNVFFSSFSVTSFKTPHDLHMAA
jgi:hypothetical protein